MTQPDFAIDQEQSEFNIFEYLGLLRKYLKIIVLFGVVGLSAGVVYWFITPPRYRASVLMKMSHISQDVIGFGQQYAWDPYRDEFFKTEFQIIRSLPVAIRVVTDLGLNFFRADYDPSLKSDNLASLIGQEIDTYGEDPDAATKRKREIQSQGSSLLGGLSADSVRGTNLVRISFTSRDPDRAQIVANAWANAYISHDLDVNYEKNLEAYTFISNKADALRLKIDSMVNNLNKLKQEKDIVAIGRNTTVEEDALSRLNDQVIEAETELSERIGALNKLEDSSYAFSSEVNDNSIIKDLTTRLAQESASYEQNLKIYKPQAPRMQSLASQIESMEKELSDQRRKVFSQLVRDATADIKAKENDLARIKANFERQKRSSAESQITSQSQIESMVSQLAVMRKQLEMLDFKKEELDLALSLKNIGRSNKVIVQEATRPGGPFAPSLKRFALAGLVLGFFLVAGLIFVLEITDRKIHTAEILERVTGLPNLATIALVQPEGKVKKVQRDPSSPLDHSEDRAKIAFLTHSSPTSPFAETYRHLRTNIQLSKAERNKVLLVTSAVSGDGKTISSVNLAISFAQLDKKILLVDCDLRRPKMHKLFRTPNQKGVVSMIVEREPLGRCVNHTAIPNLDLMTSGPLPPNPAELVASPRMGEVLAEWRDHYDYIVIDTSPLLAVTDAIIMAHQVDSVVFVSKASSTHRDDAARAMHLLAQSNIRALGTILNGYDYAQGRKYGYKYGYRRYGYGYGYGSYEYKTEKV